MFLDGAPQDVHDFCRDWDDETLAATVVDLGGHDMASLLEVFRECDDGDRPAERRVRLHRQGLGAADRRQPAQPLGAADR